jgi:phosphate transport system protein
MSSTHIVKRYDDELRELENAIAKMGGLAESQLAAAIEAVTRRDSALAAQVIEGDDKVDLLEQHVDEQVMRLFALRQPMASDLRHILSARRVASELERIADYAANVAKRAMVLNQMPAVRPVHAIPRMGQLVQAMIKGALDAYVAHDADKAVAVWRSDEQVDELYNSLFRELLTYMMEDPRSITTGAHLLFMAKNIERIGDHTTNIAEMIYFSERGEPLKRSRPKGDTTSFAVVTRRGGPEAPPS